MITLHLDDTVIRSLSKNELNILKYVYGHPEALLNMSIQELARQVSYSSATILRFCKKLGYSGFAELKYALRAELRKDEPELPPEYTFSMRLMLDTIRSNMESTSKLILEEPLVQTFRYLDSNCPIYIWAPGGLTSVAAEYFEKLLISIGRHNVYRMESSKMCEHMLGNASKDSIWIFISASGTSSQTPHLARIAKINGVPFIAISSYTNNDIADMATVNFRFFTNPREHLGAEYTSRLPIFFVINMIIRCYIQYKQLTTSLEAEHDSLI